MKSTNIRFFIGALITAVLISFWLQPKMMRLRAKNQVKVISIDQLIKDTQNPSSKPLIINLWASWCPPCLKELEAFRAFQEKTAGDVDLYLLNVDQPKDFEAAATALKTVKIKFRVYRLEQDPFELFKRLKLKWGGGLPVTIYRKPDTTKLEIVERVVTEGDLEQFTSGE